MNISVSYSQETYLNNVLIPIEFVIKNLDNWLKC